MSGSLERLVAAGLRIHPALDWSLIIVRGICNLVDRYAPDELTDLLSREQDSLGNTLDLMLLWILSGETDTFHDFDEIAADMPQLAPPGR